MATKTMTALVLVLVTAGCSKLGIGGGPKNDDEQTPYALGMMIGRSLGDFDLTPRELELVKAGLSDVVTKKKKPTDLEKFDSKVQGLRRTRMTARAVVEKEHGKKAAEAAAREPGAIRTDSGMVMRTTKPGTGTVSPSPTDKVKVHYVGRLLDGTEFDSSRKRGQPAEFPLNGVIPCWTEGVGKMKVGQVATLLCPPEIAYGDGGRPPTIPGGSTLVFEVELLEIPGGGMSAPPAPPGAPGAPPPSPHGGAH
jgi:FKBP-type peptidyl-prolyl cis-trans isomerase FkpA